MNLPSKISAHEFKSFLESGFVLRYEASYFILLGPFGKAKAGQFQFFSPSFFMDSDIETLSSEKVFQVSEEHFKMHLANYAVGKGADYSTLDWQEPSFEDYKVAFEKIQTEIKSGRLEKAVPVLFAKATDEFDSLKRAQALQHLSKMPHRLFVYGCWHEGAGMLGATPETLVNIFSDSMKSMALAGTQIKADGECHLLEDPKELHEHELVVRDMLAVFKKFGDVKADGPQVLDLPSLWHLKTDIHGHIRDRGAALSLVKSLHPTPALGVFPREFNFQWMRELPEADIRKKYGAPFVLIFPNGDLISVVAIRNIQWAASEIILGAGGGVVETSKLEKEWLEIAGKRNAVRAMMGFRMS